MSVELILASNSPRRLLLLQQLGITAKVLSVEIDESPHPNETATQYVMRMAKEKNQQAQAIARKTNQYLPILTADTCIALDQQILGKPASPIVAKTMLQQLSGRTHQVLTAITLSFEKQQLSCLQQSEVTFKPLSQREIDNYITSGEPLDKAGAYAIQGKAAAFIQRLSGSYSGVMGLPLFETSQLLQQLGFELDYSA
ncbi:septum formation inhibitor Maf [Mergibacter septicus]|uniref:Maf family protein n=1 Tax=Mergibacter septicus TaxID=221402 RepID=UPI001178F2D6|nr:nucleoside triphosphate pyrophosphatase [Mergibacter septicus]AWX14497.1 septum formation inhibitor Maf [Mergibacter septicus]